MLPDGEAAANPEVALAVRPEHITFSSASAEAGDLPVNKITGHIADSVFLGEITEWVVKTAPQIDILVRSTLPLSYAVGDQVTLQFAPERTICVVN